MQEAILGALLVGGESRRMGRDKALLPTAHGPLAEVLARRLETVTAEVVLVTRETPDPRFPDHWVVADRRSGRGPLAGLAAALAVAETEGHRAVLALACDLPRVTPELLRWVVGDGFSPGDLPAARVPEADGRLQPLCALYSTACAPVARDLLDRENQEGGTWSDPRRASLHALLDRVAVTRLPVHDGLPFHRPDPFHNLNTPEDLSAILGPEAP